MKKLMYTILIAICVILTVVALFQNDNRDFNKSEYDVISYSVEQGDTLYGIGLAHKLAEDNIYDWIDAVQALNNISSNIYVGQTILIYG